MQRLLLLAVLAKSHNAVELLVVLTADLAAELIDLILKANRFTLNTGGFLKDKTNEPLVLQYGVAMIS